MPDKGESREYTSYDLADTISVVRSGKVAKLSESYSAIGNGSLFMMAPLGFRRFLGLIGLSCAATSWLCACSSKSYDVPSVTDKGGDSSVGTTGGASNNGGKASTSGGTTSESGGETSATAGASTEPAATGGSTGGDGITCKSDSDCAVNATLRVCDTVNETCVECLPGKTNCGKDLYCGSNKECQLGCSANADCSTEHCNVELHQCEGCSSDKDCGLGMVCDTDTGVCSPSCDSTETCPSGWACCGNVCVNPNLDEANCGSCATSCERANASVECREASCVNHGCLDGYADCNGKASDGCESNLKTEAEHCGSCDSVCGTTNGTASCNQGTCAIACASNYADCDGSTSNGCETNLTSTVKNCGSCGNECHDGTNGTAVCRSGVCGLSNCAAPYGDCDGNPSNGCESNSKTDVNNCGGCGNTCSLAHATAACTNGGCDIASCDVGWEDCDGVSSNGCEVNVLSSSANCGACGATCTPSNATGACVKGACTVSTCSVGYQDCNAKATDGCEIKTQTDVNNCGSCGNACSTVHGSASCSAGSCGITCTKGFADCDDKLSTGCETVTTNDVYNCGACGTKCSVKNGAASCANSVCGVGSCTSGYADCDATYSNGCETNVANDPLNCNACGAKCDGTNGSASCSSGACGISCSTGYATCDGNLSNGCEVNLQTDRNHCGTCDKVCDAASSGCIAGVCAPTPTPCTGKCSNPKHFTINDGTHTSTAASLCFESYDAEKEFGLGGCGDFVSILINGTQVSCSGGWTWGTIPKPASVNGGYCFYGAVATSASTGWFNTW
jgi:hypothetical protein